MSENKLKKQIKMLLSTDIQSVEIDTHDIHYIESIMSQNLYEMEQPRLENIFGWDGNFEYKFRKTDDDFNIIVPQQIIELTGSLYYGNYKLIKYLSKQ